MFRDLGIDACRAAVAAVLGDATSLRFAAVVIEQQEEVRQTLISIRCNACASDALSLGQTVTCRVVTWRTAPVRPCGKDAPRWSSTLRTPPTAGPGTLAGAGRMRSG